MEKTRRTVSEQKLQSLLRMDISITTVTAGLIGNAAYEIEANNKNPARAILIARSFGLEQSKVEALIPATIKMCEDLMLDVNTVGKSINLLKILSLTDVFPHGTVLAAHANLLYQENNFEAERLEKEFRITAEEKSLSALRAFETADTNAEYLLAARIARKCEIGNNRAREYAIKAYTVAQANGDSKTASNIVIEFNLDDGKLAKTKYSSLMHRGKFLEAAELARIGTLDREKENTAAVKAIGAILSSGNLNVYLIHDAKRVMDGHNIAPKEIALFVQEAIKNLSAMGYYALAASTASEFEMNKSLVKELASEAFVKQLQRGEYKGLSSLARRFGLDEAVISAAEEIEHLTIFY